MKKNSVLVPKMQQMAATTKVAIFTALPLHLLDFLCSAPMCFLYFFLRSALVKNDELLMMTSVHTPSLPVVTEEVVSK